jgi:predicted lipoprotein with Yx(FWY)xxD motif
VSRIRPAVIRWAAATLAATGGLGAASAVLPAAHAMPAATSSVASHRAVVVKVVTRRHFGKILATVHGRTLYIKPHGRCSGACVSVWPRLLMPKGKTVPLGTRCLGTARAGHRRQVTYRGKRLYLFSGDSGHSVNGNNLSGFKVAKLVSGAC